MARNTRTIGGNSHFRRFAYLHKRDASQFGLLEATGYQDAKRHLGSMFHIRQTWLTEEERFEQERDKKRRWEIVSSIFLNPFSAGYINKSGQYEPAK